MITIYQGDCLDWLSELGEFDMCFADPPDNIGLNYQGFVDKNSEYEAFLIDILEAMWKVAPISWMSFNAKHMGIVGNAVNWWKPKNYRFFVQTFTFGQNRQTDFVNGFRPILRLMHDGVDTFPDAVRVRSWRQENGDKRAGDKGKVPDDVWDFPRVTHNSHQRRKWSPTQLHEGLYKRAIDFSTRPGDRIVDLFAGSGTMARVADATHDVHLIELSEPTFKNLCKEFDCE